jgi:hypothetical protein
MVIVLQEQSYIFCARSGLDLDEDSLSLKAKERMKLDASSCVIVLSATATNIIQHLKICSRQLEEKL